MGKKRVPLRKLGTLTTTLGKPVLKDNYKKSNEFTNNHVMKSIVKDDKDHSQSLGNLDDSEIVDEDEEEGDDDDEDENANVISLEGNIANSKDEIQEFTFEFYDIQNSHTESICSLLTQLFCNPTNSYEISKAIVSQSEFQYLLNIN